MIGPIDSECSRQGEVEGALISVCEYPNSLV